MPKFAQDNNSSQNRTKTTSTESPVTVSIPQVMHSSPGPPPPPPPPPPGPPPPAPIKCQGAVQPSSQLLATCQAALATPSLATCLASAAKALASLESWPELEGAMKKVNNSEDGEGKMFMKKLLV